MNIIDLINKKRNNEIFTKEEINYIIDVLMLWIQREMTN